MKLEKEEIDQLAEALAPRVAGILLQSLEEIPDWCMSIREAAVWAKVPEHVIRDAIASGRLPCVNLSRRNIRIRRSDLFAINGQKNTSPESKSGEARVSSTQNQEGGDDRGTTAPRF